ncbi:MAG: hypothetical protein ABL888_22990, partial [Pirellulaceae bacterium]
KYGYQNEMDKRSVYQIFHGTVTADNNSFLVTDSGDVPQGESSSTNMLLPETDFGVDSSYGNPITGLTPWGGFDVPFTTNGTGPGGTNGSGEPQPGDSPLTLGTGNNLDLGLFSSAYGYKGETVGASFAWQLPTTGTPTDPASFGDAVFNSGNMLNNGGTNEADGQSGQLSPGDLIKEILVAKYGMNDPYVWAFLQSGGRIEVFDFWFFSGYTDFYEDSEHEWAPVFQLDDNLAVNPFAAADIVYQMLHDHEDANFGKFVHDKDLVSQAKRRMGLAAVRAADRSEEVLRIAMSACDAGEFVMAMHDLADKKIPIKQKLLIAALVAIPFVSAKFGKAGDFFDSNGNAIKSKLDEAMGLFNSSRYVYPQSAVAMTAFRAEMRAIKEAFKKARGGVDPDLFKNWDKVVFENGKPVFAKFDPMTNTINVYRGADEISLMEELLHFDIQQRYLKGHGLTHAEFVAMASKWTKQQWINFRAYHEAEVKRRFLGLGFTER